MKFAVLMAWRDFRAKPSRFLLYVTAIAIGVGSLTAIDSFRRELASAIHRQGRDLLGADLQLRSRRPFTPEQELVVQSWTGRKARSISYRTLLLNPANGTTRLVEVDAVEQGFPFYGALTTVPPDAGHRYQQQNELLVDHSLLLQMSLTNGMYLSVGGQMVRLAGAVMKSPGEVPARSFVAPRVYLPYSFVNPDRLSQPGTLARFEYFFAGEDEAEPALPLNLMAASARQAGMDVETVESRREQLLGSTDRIGRYLGLIGFTSLLIGCLGVMGAIHFFISTKKRTVAQLRCIGAGLKEAAGMFIVQLIGLAIAGSTLGVGLGALAGTYLPVVMSDFIPVPVDFALRIESVVSAWLIGMVFTILSGILPVLQLRFISPLIALRIQPEGSSPRFDLASLYVAMLLLVVLAGFAVEQLGSVKLAGMYLGGVAVVLALLLVTGLWLRKMCRLLFRSGWTYSLRLAVSSMYRPQNQTGLLIVSIGMGIFLLNMVDIMEQHMLSDVVQENQPRPNIAMIDIQVDQRDALLNILSRYQTQSIYTEPMITMRLAAINGTDVYHLETESGQGRPNWALKREYRTTYRSEIKPEIESVVDGVWVDSEQIGVRPVPISMEKGIAEALRVGVGDRMTFDVHGEEMETVVQNIREVNWKSMQPNFFVIFPRGVIEEAPQTFLVFCQMDDEHQRALFQRDVAQQFPNVTAIDISMMMDAVAGMMQQLAAAVRSMAWFTIAAGLLVLVAILRAGWNQRLQEGVLLRTIGASSTLIVRYQVFELCILAVVAMFSGLVLSWLAGGLVVHFAFKLPFRPDWLSSGYYAGILLIIISFMGVLNGWSATRMKPAAAWRSVSFSAS